MSLPQSNQVPAGRQAPAGNQTARGELSIAAVVPTRDRADSLARLIRALLAQTRRPDELLIIDDGQLAPDVLAGWQASCESAGTRFAYHRKSAPGRSASRNLAVGLTTCDVVCFLDDDAEPTPPFLERMLAGLKSYGRWQAGQAESRSALVAVEGMIVSPAGPRLGDQVYAALLFLSGFWLLAQTGWPGKLTDNLRSRPFLGGVCVVYRDALSACRFDESMSHGEDREWSVRVARLGRIGRVTDAVCLHHVEPGGRGSAYATGLRMARNYMYSQRKLFGFGGAIAGGLTLLSLAAGEAAMGLLASLGLRRSGPRLLARAGGLVVGLITPTRRRGD